MKIFFTASIHGKKKYEENYRKIADLVKKNGYQIQADHILDNDHESMSKWDKTKDLDFHRWVFTQAKKADIVFAEASYTSTSVGYLVSQAVEAGRPVVIFYSGQEEPHLFRTLEEDNDRVLVVRYKDVSDLEGKVKEALEYASESQDVRFNFFISPKHANYLNWIAKNKRIPRSVFLRRLIDEERKKTS